MGLQLSYPDQGTDSRLLPGLGWLQRLSIIHGAAPKDVEAGYVLGWRIRLQKWPPFILAEKAIPSGFRQVRLGWTWRQTQQYYLFGMAFKKEHVLLPDYAGLGE